MRPRVSFAAAALACFWVTVPAALAQDAAVAGIDQNAPIEVEADHGIEWLRNERTIVARGNATAKQKDVTVRADTLTARYREADGRIRIDTVEAVGNVNIVSGSNTLRGNRATYDVEREVLTVTGDQVVLVTPDQRVTSDRSMEFDNKAQVATARGNATVVTGDRRIRADLLKAHLSKDASGKTSLQRVEGFGNVHVSTPTEVARAEKGTYDLRAETASLSGSVRITRGDNQLNGDNAVFDLRGGTSRLTGTPGDSGGRVRALIVPRRTAGNARAP